MLVCVRAKVRSHMCVRQFKCERGAGACLNCACEVCACGIFLVCGCDTKYPEKIVGSQ